MPEKMLGRGRPRKYGEKMEAFSVRLPPELFLRLSHFAVDARASLNEAVNVAVRQYMDGNPNPEKFEPPELGSAQGDVSRKSR